MTGFYGVKEVFCRRPTVIVDILGIVLFSRVDSVVRAGDFLETLLLGQDCHLVGAQVDDAAQYEAALGVGHPHLLPLHLNE